MKFKPGDRVVCQIRTGPTWPYDKRIATVTSVDVRQVKIKYDAPDLCNEYFRAFDKIELESVYNSPLYKALA